MSVTAAVGAELKPVNKTIFGATIFGGFAPVIIAWLIAQAGSTLAPSFYLTFGAAASLAALYAARTFGLR